jgi:hypothetical protein
MVKTLPSSKNWTRSNRKKRSISSCFTTSIVILLVIYLYYLYHLYYFLSTKNTVNTDSNNNNSSKNLSFSTKDARTGSQTMSDNDNMLPRVLAFVFPQFHEDSLNNYLWGKGFTDWNNLNQSLAKNRLGFSIPRPTELGFYNYVDLDPRKKQG